MAAEGRHREKFMGRELPRLRKGNVWTVTIWPGGRKVVSQMQRDYVRARVAIALLLLGHRATVLLSDAEEVEKAVQLEVA